MNFASFFIFFEIDPEICSTEAEKLLRTLANKIKHNFRQSLAIRTVPELSGLAISFFDESAKRLHQRAREILDVLEEASEARISFHQLQWYAWLDGRFVETEESVARSKATGKNFDTQNPQGQYNYHTPALDKKKMIIYEDAENAEDDIFFAKKSLGRKNFRIPTRK